MSESLPDILSIDQPLRKEVEIAHRMQPNAGKYNSSGYSNSPTYNLFNEENSLFESDGNLSFTSVVNSNDSNNDIDSNNGNDVNNDNDVNNFINPKSDMNDAKTFIDAKNEEVNN